jgi:hypothetical protein
MQINAKIVNKIMMFVILLFEDVTEEEKVKDITIFFLNGFVAHITKSVLNHMTI